MASYNANSSSSVDNHRLSAVTSKIMTPNVPAPIQDTPKPATAKRSSSVGAAFRSMFSRRSDVLETVPTPWTGQLSSIDIAQAIETQNRPHSQRVAPSTHLRTRPQVQDSSNSNYEVAQRPSSLTRPPLRPGSSPQV